MSGGEALQKLKSYFKKKVISKKLKSWSAACGSNPSAVFRWGENVGEKATSVTVAHCSTFRLFVVNIVLP